MWNTVRGHVVQRTNLSTEIVPTVTSKMEKRRTKTSRAQQIQVSRPILGTGNTHRAWQPCWPLSSSFSGHTGLCDAGPGILQITFGLGQLAPLESLQQGAPEGLKQQGWRRKTCTFFPCASPVLPVLSTSTPAIVSLWQHSASLQQQPIPVCRFSMDFMLPTTADKSPNWAAPLFETPSFHGALPFTVWVLITATLLFDPPVQEMRTASCNAHSIIPQCSHLTLR